MVFLAALAARATWGTWRVARATDRTALEFPDEQQYWLMARSLAAGQGLRDELGFRATRMPLYPAMLALFAPWQHGVIAAKAFHWVLGAVVAALTAGLAGAMFGRPVQWIAGLLVALDPFLVFFSSLLLTETLFTGVLVALMWAAWPLIGGSGPGRASPAPERTAPRRARVWWAVAGLSILAVYARESSLGLIVVLLVFVVLCRRFERRTVTGSLLICGAVFAGLSPWAVRNRLVTGDWCWLTHRGGISLYDGVGPQATGASDLGSIKQMPEVRGLDEAEWNRYFLRESFRAIRNDPGRVFALSATKLARMWNPFPNVDTYQSGFTRFVSAGWTVPTFALALAGVILMLLSDRASAVRAALFLLLPALYLTLLHSVFVGSVRYRLGALPFLHALAAVALAAAVSRRRASVRNG